MATNLPGGRCLFEKNVCVIRVARLNSDCSLTIGVNNAAVSTGIVTMTRSAEIEEGQEFNFKNGCGTLIAYAADQDNIKRFNLSGELLTMDHELLEIMFGGSVLVGAAATSFAGQNMGYARPIGFNASNGVSLEVWTQAVFGVGGGCSSDATAPAYVRHVFPRVTFVEGDRVFENDIAKISFNGKAFANPAWGNGPFNDSTVVFNGGYTNSAHFEFQEATLPAAVSSAGCGYVTVPADTS